MKQYIYLIEVAILILSCIFLNKALYLGLSITVMLKLLISTLIFVVVLTTFSQLLSKEAFLTKLTSYVRLVFVLSISLYLFSFAIYSSHIMTTVLRNNVIILNAVCYYNFVLLSILSLVCITSKFMPSYMFGNFSKLYHKDEKFQEKMFITTMVVCFFLPSITNKIFNTDFFLQLY